MPTGNVVDTLKVPGYGTFKASLVDAANATCFVNAADLGIKGTEMPDELDRNAEVLKKLAAIRIAASVAMGIARTPEEAAEKRGVPFVGFVSGPQAAVTLAGDRIEAEKVDLTARMISNGQPHRALPLTVTLCTAVAARIEGSLVHQAARPASDPDGEIRIAMPSGILTVAANVYRKDGSWYAEQGAFFRTQRRLFEGYVYVRASRVGAGAGKGHAMAA